MIMIGGKEISSETKTYIFARSQISIPKTVNRRQRNWTDGNGHILIQISVRNLSILREKKKGDEWHKEQDFYA